MEDAMTEPTLTAMHDAGLADDLAALLDRHGVSPTVDGLLAELKRRDCWISLNIQWFAEARQSDMPCSVIGTGPTPLIALARAFAAMIDAEEQSCH
jgi:hypothetical protein